MTVGVDFDGYSPARSRAPRAPVSLASFSAHRGGLTQRERKALGPVLQNMFAVLGVSAPPGMRVVTPLASNMQHAHLYIIHIVTIVVLIRIAA